MKILLKELNRIYYDAIETITLLRYLLLILEKEILLKLLLGIINLIFIYWKMKLSKRLLKVVNLKKKKKNS